MIVTNSLLLSLTAPLACKPRLDKPRKVGARRNIVENAVETDHVTDKHRTRLELDGYLLLFSLLSISLSLSPLIYLPPHLVGLIMLISGTPINRLPIMAKSVLDLYELYNLVIARGGLVDVINKKLWQEIIKGLHLPSSITSAAFTLRTQ